LQLCLPSLVLIGALAPRQAHACDPVFDECPADLELVTEGPLPLDGALVWRPAFSDPATGYFSASSLEEATTVVVTPMGGGPEVPGTVAAVGDAQALVWRPTEPLPADTGLEVEVTVDNGALICGGDFEPTLTKMWTVTTGSELAPPPAVPELTGETSVALNDTIELDNLVCCDGAFPTWTMLDDCGLGVLWSEGTCAALSGVGWLDAALVLDPGAVAATGGQVAYVFESNAGMLPFVAGTTEITARASQPICGKVRATRLADGEQTVGPEVCFGKELQAMLGEQAIDPLPTLAACAGQPYTCEIVELDQSWDPAACTPWPEGEAPTTSAGSEGSSGESDSSTGGGGSSGSSGSSGSGEASDSDTAGTDTDKGGCACATGPVDSGWGIVALVLPWLTRRRSRR
jgi:MYXO-CTERM domain-containing protein